MAIKMIRPESIAFHATVTESEIRARMAQEVLEQVGALDTEGKKLPGVSVNVRRGSGSTGGYTIDITGPMPARIMLPSPSSSPNQPSQGL